MPEGIERRARWLAGGLIALAIGLVTNAILGPLSLGAIEYQFSETLTNQGIGLDVIALAGAAPIAAAAAGLILRGHRAGPVLAFIPATFSAYMAPQYAIGPDYLGMPGNNEQFFLFHLARFVLGVVLVFAAWQQVDRSRLPSSARADRLRSWVMFGVVAFISLRWIPGMIELTAGDPTLVDYVVGPTSYVLIGFLDLGMVVPAALAAGVALWLGAGWARTAAYGVIGWFALVPAAVAGMAIAMWVNDDPNATGSQAILMTVFAVVFTIGAALLYRPLFGSPTAVSRSRQSLPDSW